MNVTPKYQHTLQTLEGYFMRRWQLAVTGLTAGADNVIPHQLPCGVNAPRGVSYRPQADGGWHEYQVPDATNLYIHVDASGPTSFVIDTEFAAS